MKNHWLGSDMDPYVVPPEAFKDFQWQERLQLSWDHMRALAVDLETFIMGLNT